MGPPTREDGLDAQVEQGGERLVPREPARNMAWCMRTTRVGAPLKTENGTLRPIARDGGRGRVTPR